MERVTLSVAGLSCESCERTIEHSLTTVDGVTRVEAHHEAETVDVVVTDDVSADDLSDAIRDAGYEPLA
ncbi:heavy-metal-associated domain-containing protein [Halopiger djelfimassiliensis]|uniref:heavy-metal-associated domain-containing protein n=1 Tax=Halopiger djelfimassiliensis TaxID=1293047 RepID=UPI000677E7C2|nr:heavy metal-associated domain-containing protein [Halopiger djelfimassiliensis]